MAITFVGSDSNDGGGVTSVALTLPTHQQLDVGIIYGRADEQGTVANLSVEGWIEIANENPTGGRDSQEYLWVRVFESDSEANPTMISDNAEQLSASVHVFRGVDVGVSLDADVQFLETQNDTVSPTPPDITTVTDNACVICFLGMTHDDLTAVTQPTGYTMGEEIWGATKDFRQQITAYILDAGTAGVISPPDWALTSNDTIAESRQFTVALKPKGDIQLYLPLDNAIISDELRPPLSFIGDGTTNVTFQIQISDNINFDIIDEYDEINQNQSLPLYQSYIEHFGQSFTGDGNDLVSVDFYLKKVGTPDSTNMTVSLYAHTGTFGTDSKPTGSILATSNGIDPTTLTTSYQMINFTFPTPYTLVDGTYYCLMLSYNSALSNVSNCVQVGYDSTTPTHAGNSFYSLTLPTFITADNYDVVFKAYTNVNDFISNTDVGFDGDFSQIIDEYPSSNESTSTDIGTFQTKVGQSFTGADTDLKTATFYIKKTGTPTGNMKATLYAHTGTYGVNGKGTGTALSSSDNLLVQDLTTSYQEITFTFSTPYTLVDGTYYVIMIESEDCTETNRIDVAQDGTSPSHSGNFVSYDFAIWGGSSSRDVIFRINSDPFDPFPIGEIVRYTPQADLDEIKYYWRARVYDTAWSEYSQSRTFTLFSASKRYFIIT